MRRVAIVQARMGSTRLPGKVLMPIHGVPMLTLQLERLRRARNLDDIVIATSDQRLDDAIADHCRALGVQVVRGSESDVLARYALASRATRADLVVRITADCPLIDWEVVDTVVEQCVACDYASNVLVRTYPVGLDTEALYADTIERLARIATSPAAREHVTWFIREEQRHLFVTRSIEAPDDNARLRWTVDTEANITHVTDLYAGGARTLSYREILKLDRSTYPGLAR